MNAEQISGLVRHLATTLGAGAVTAGYLSQDQLIQAAGGLAVIVGVIWSIWAKRNKQ